MAASPSLSFSKASDRSGIDRVPLTVTHETMPCFSSPATWSAISATSGEMTTVTAPVLWYRDSAGIW